MISVYKLKDAERIGSAAAHALLELGQYSLYEKIYFSIILMFFVYVLLCKYTN